jgi:hypothetical protein
MNKKLLGLIFALHIVMLTNGQLIVTPQIQQVGIYLKTQLWNIAISNTATVSKNIKISALITNSVTNQPTLSVSMDPFNVAPGITQYAFTNFSNMQYTVLDNSQNVDANPNGFLPIGSFEVCYTLLDLSSGDLNATVQECLSIEVEPLSPPLLIFPENESESETTSHLFSWQPPIAFAMAGIFAYDLQIVEIESTQTPAEAILQNVPLFRQLNINSIQLQYPANAPQLQFNKEYAWQIKAKINGLFVAASEVWKFKLISAQYASSMPQVAFNPPFVKLLKYCK